MTQPLQGKSEQERFAGADRIIPVRVPLADLLMDQAFSSAYQVALQSPFSLSTTLDLQDTKKVVIAFLTAKFSELGIDSSSYALPQSKALQILAEIAVTAEKVKGSAEKLLKSENSQDWPQAQHRLSISNLIFRFVENALSTVENRSYYISIEQLSNTLDRDLQSDMLSRLAASLDLPEGREFFTAFYDRAINFLDDNQNLNVRGFSVQDKVALLRDKLHSAPNVIIPDRFRIERGYFDFDAQFLSSDGAREIRQRFSNITEKNANDLKLVKGILLDTHSKDSAVFEKGQKLRAERITQLAAQFHVIPLSADRDQFQQIDDVVMEVLRLAINENRYIKGALVCNVLEAVKKWQPAPTLRQQDQKTALFDGIARYAEQISYGWSQTTLIHRKEGGRIEIFQKDLDLLSQYAKSNQANNLGREQIIADLEHILANSSLPKTAKADTSWSLVQWIKSLFISNP